VKQDLDARGFRNVVLWSRGVDLDIFRRMKSDRLNTEPPIFLYVGRVAVEKNIEAFLNLDLPGSKVVVGDGPAREALQAKYPQVLFAGARFGDELAAFFAGADVFVFPSLTDTFGLVILEAMAAGSPVAAFPAPGPIDIIPGSGAGAIDQDLRAACLACLEIAPSAARAYAERFSWRACAEEFVRNLQPYPEPEKSRFWRRIRRLARLRRRLV
jgi:glycosyltransferase involved in cell wall biosynthesis